VSILSSLRTILFDLDGVLVDSRAPIARSINHALARSGLTQRPERELHGRIGDALHGIFVDLLREEGADPARASECMAHYRELYRELSLSETRLVPGIEPLLGALASGRRLAVASSKPVEFSRPILERLGVSGRFAAVVGPSLAHLEGEPKAETARRALEALGGAAGGAALVGDRHHDVSAARALGLAAIGVTWGSGSEAELREAGAEWIVAAPAELGRLLGA
jgi:phosphoglycolate phosphatase